MVGGWAVQWVRRLALAPSTYCPAFVTYSRQILWTFASEKPKADSRHQDHPDLIRAPGRVIGHTTPQKHGRGPWHVSHGRGLDSTTWDTGLCNTPVKMPRLTAAT